MIERTYLILQNIATGLFSIADEGGNQYISGLDTLDAAHEWLEERFRQIGGGQGGQPNDRTKEKVSWHWV
jgi:hypothetical protein